MTFAHPSPAHCPYARLSPDTGKWDYECAQLHQICDGNRSLLPCPQDRLRGAVQLANLVKEAND